MSWQPIETAPRDGTKLLGWYHGGDIQIIMLNEDVYAKTPHPFWFNRAVWSGRDQRANQPTHWMPLPDPPKENAP